MKKYDVSFDSQEYQMRLLSLADFESYYRCGFENPDEEVNYYTGTTEAFSKDKVQDYVKRIVDDETRYDFLILKGEEIIGEVVLNEIQDGQAHFRIALFSKAYFSKGIGYWATACMIAFAFDTLSLNTIELEVFSFNTRGIALYKKLGFVSIGTFRDDDAQELYRDYIKMTKSKGQDEHN